MKELAKRGEVGGNAEAEEKEEAEGEEEEEEEEEGKDDHILGQARNSFLK